MTHFEVNGQKYIGVEVPEGASDFTINKTSQTVLAEVWYTDIDHTGNHIGVPAGNYEIVGLVKNLTNDDMRNILGVSPSSLFLADWVELKFRNNLTDNTLILKIKENE